MGLLSAAVHSPRRFWLSDRRGFEVLICCILCVLSTCGQANFDAGVLGNRWIVQAICCVGSCVGSKAIISDVMGHAAKHVIIIQYAKIRVVQEAAQDIHLWLCVFCCPVVYTDCQKVNECDWMALCIALINNVLRTSGHMYSIGMKGMCACAQACISCLYVRLQCSFI